jgi:hypothetical protein
MARKIAADMKASDLIDTEGAKDILHCTKSRVHQLAQEGKLKAYIFIDGELVEAEGIERQGKIALFNRYEVGDMRNKMPGRGRRKKETSLPTSQ